MFTWLFRLVVGSAVLAGALWLLRAVMKRWIDGPEVEPSTAPWPPLVDPLGRGPDEGDRAGESSGPDGGGGPATRAGGNGVSAAAATGGANGVSAAAANGSGPASTKTGVSSGSGVVGLASNGVGDETAAVPPDSTDRTWVRFDEIGDALASYPVKAKESSGLYHMPGMLAYARTRPDRCYPSAEDAEADGFARAKR
jgi:hypothetical protein